MREGERETERLWPFRDIVDDAAIDVNRREVERVANEARPARRLPLVSILQSPLVTDQAAVYVLGHSIRRLSACGVPRTKLIAKLTNPGQFAHACAEIITAGRLTDVLDVEAVTLDWRTAAGSRPDVHVKAGGVEYACEFEGLGPSQRELAHRAAATRFASTFDPNAHNAGHHFLHRSSAWTATDDPGLLPPLPIHPVMWKPGRWPELCGWTVRAPADVDNELKRFRSKFRDAARQLPTDMPGIIAVQRHTALSAERCADILYEEFEQAKHVVFCLLTHEVLLPGSEDYLYWLFPRAGVSLGRLTTAGPFTEWRPPSTEIVEQAISYNDYRAFRYWARGADNKWHLVADSNATGTHESKLLPMSIRLLPFADEEFAYDSRGYKRRPIN